MTRTRVAVNEYISMLGISGSSRASGSIKDALFEQKFDVFSVRPRHIPSWGPAKAVHMASWDFLGSSRRARELEADVVVHSANTGATRAGIPSVLVMYDTMVLDHPGLFDPRFVKFAQLTYGPSARAADVVVTCSWHSAERIRSRWPSVDVRVIPWPSYSHATVNIPSVKARPDYVLVVASLDRHKRTDLAIEVVKELRAVSGDDVSLVIVGRDGNDSKARSLIARENDSGDWIKFMSGITDDELSSLYANAMCLLVSSLDEGYCLPALEATVLGTPVVHGNRGALSELAPRPNILAYGSRQEERDSLVHQINAVKTNLPVAADWLSAARRRLWRAEPGAFAQSWSDVIREVLG